MKIITYRAGDTEAPASALAVAHILLSKDRKGNPEWLPVVFRAATEDDARAKAQAHWDAELEKVRQAARNREAMSARRRKPPAEAQPEPVIEEAF